jgi:hypothetical protein
LPQLAANVRTYFTAETKQFIDLMKLCFLATGIIYDFAIFKLTLVIFCIYSKALPLAGKHLIFGLY